MDYIFEPLNPWWENSTWITEKYERTELKDILTILNNSRKKARAPLLVGPRRVGKTTLMYQVARAFLKKIPANNILYYSFERADPEIQHNPDAINDIVFKWGNKEFDSKKPRLLLLDEIQNVKNWGPKMKTILESTFQSPLLIVMTGSSSFDLLGESLQSLFGLTRRIAIPPFSLKDFWLMKYPDDMKLVEEIEHWRKAWFNLKNEKHFSQAIHVKTMMDDMWKKALKIQCEWLKKGGFPEFWEDRKSQVASELYDFYVRRVAQDDILQIKNISSPIEVARFLKYCYFHPGSELNVTTASQELGIPRSTLDNMLDLIVHAGYLRVIPRYSGNSAILRQRNIKIYPIDQALIPSSIRYNDENELSPTGMTMETLVANIFSRIEESEIFFLRKKNGRETNEIDFIVKAGKKLIAIEVKKRANRDDLEKFRQNIQKLDLIESTKILICWDTDEKGLIKDYLPPENPLHIETIPLWRIALGLPSSILLNE